MTLKACCFDLFRLLVWSFLLFMVLYMSRFSRTADEPWTIAAERHDCCSSSFCTSTNILDTQHLALDLFCDDQDDSIFVHRMYIGVNKSESESLSLNFTNVATDALVSTNCFAENLKLESIFCLNETTGCLVSNVNKLRINIIGTAGTNVQSYVRYACHRVGSFGT